VAIPTSLWVGLGIKLLVKLLWEVTEAMRAHTPVWGLGEGSSPCGSNGGPRRRSDPRARGAVAFYRWPALAKVVRESSLRHGRGVRRRARPGTAAT
jgi:hypothetical protein